MKKYIKPSTMHLVLNTASLLSAVSQPILEGETGTGEPDEETDKGFNPLSGRHQSLWDDEEEEEE